VAKDIAALSSGDKTAFRSALGGMSYLTPISDAVTVSAPVDHIDFALPASGYSSFLVTMAGVEVQGAPSNYFALIAALSSDGTTFISDQSGFDTYAYVLNSGTGVPNGSNVGAAFDSNYDAVAKLMGTTPFTYIYSANLWINPGETGLYPSLMFDGFFRTLDDTGHCSLVRLNSACTLFPEATIPPTLVRHTKVRLGSGTDPNDPSALGLSFGAGHFNLYGIPTA
jgi:hypothetical protein